MSARDGACVPCARSGVLTIGTTESRGIVGLGLDLRLLAERGTPAQSVVVAVSAQGPGLHELTPLTAASVDAQFASLDRRYISSIRIGALPTLASIERVAAHLATFADLPVVLDPVVASSRGGALALEETAKALRDVLLPRVTVVLPNLAEARAIACEATNDLSGMERAARALVRCGVRAALVTGGHLAGDPVDVLVDGDASPVRFSAPRIDREMRGTGCVLAVSLAAELAEGGGDARDLSPERLVSAIGRAREAVRMKIAHAKRAGDQWVA